MSKSFLNQFGKIVAKPNVQEAPRQGVPVYLDSLARSKDEATQKISSLFTVLGKAYYEAHADSGQTEFEPQMAEIRNLYAKIAEYGQQAEEISAGKRCASCGAQLAEGSLFCNICGVKLQEVPGDAEKKGQNLCPQCGAEIQPGDLFCVSCGANIDDNSQSENLLTQNPDSIQMPGPKSVKASKKTVWPDK